ADRDCVGLLMRCRTERLAEKWPDQSVVIEALLGHRAAGKSEYDHLLESVMERNLFEQRQQSVIYDQHAIAGIRGNPADLRRREPQVQRMQHRPNERDSKVTFEMDVMIPT